MSYPHAGTNGVHFKQTPDEKLDVMKLTMQQPSGQVEIVPNFQARDIQMRQSVARPKSARVGWRPEGVTVDTTKKSPRRPTTARASPRMEGSPRAVVGKRHGLKTGFDKHSLEFDYRPIIPGEKKSKKKKKYVANIDLKPESDDHVLEEREEKQTETSVMCRKDVPNDKYISLLEIRNRRQSVLLQSATLASKHKIRYPACKTDVVKAQREEKLNVLNKQDAIGKTEAVINAIMPQTTQESSKDMNTEVFGWDPLSEETGGCQQVWNEVDSHVHRSALIQNTIQSQACSLETAFQVLCEISESSNDAVVKGALHVVGSTLKDAIYCDGDRKITYFDRMIQTEEENDQLRERVEILKHQLDDALNKSDDEESDEGSKEGSEENYFQQKSQTEKLADQVENLLQENAYSEEHKAQAITLLYARRVIPLNEHVLVNMLDVFRGIITIERTTGRRESEEERLYRYFERLFVDCCRARDCIQALKAIFTRVDAERIAERLLNGNPGIEKLLLISSRSMPRQVTFWEVHWKKFCDMLWLSSELIPLMISQRQDIVGKILNSFSDWLGFGSSCQRAHNEHRLVLESILVQILDQNGCAILESALLRNRQSLRELFESGRCGEELVNTLAKSSPITVSKILDNCKPVLGRVLEERSSLLMDVLRTDPAFLTSLARLDFTTFGNALGFEKDTFPKICVAVPSLVFDLVDQHSELISDAACTKVETVVSILRKARDEDVTELVLGDHPDLLVNNPQRLNTLGLKNVEVYRSNCNDQMVQTDFIHISHGNDGSVNVKPLIEIVGKRRLHKATTTGWTCDVLHKKVAALYQEKVDADMIDDRAGHSREPFPDMIHDHFASEHDDIAIGKKVLSNFVLSLRMHWESSALLYWFSILAGVTAPEEFQSQGADFFISLLLSMIPSHDVEKCMNDHDGLTVIPLASALENVSHILRIYWYNKADYDLVLEKLRELETCMILEDDLGGDYAGKRMWTKTKKPRKTSIAAQVVDPGSRGKTKKSMHARSSMRDTIKNKLIKRKTGQAAGILDSLQACVSGKVVKSRAHTQFGGLLRTSSPEIPCVSLYATLHVLMSEWMAFEKNEIQVLEELFCRGDTNGDGVLSEEEFAEMVRIIDPTCDKRTIRRMFKLTGEETEDGQQAITPIEFVKVMRRHKYTGPAIAHLLRYESSDEEVEEDKYLISLGDDDKSQEEQPIETLQG